MKTRNEMKKEYTWNIADIFAGEKEFNSALEKIKSLVPEIIAYEGKIGESFENFKNVLDKYFELVSITENVGVYAYMFYSEDGSNP
ncbi:MAG: hypothetical protein MJ072_02795 [Clostridia bacterium]|nr:hypothetical protein [Clostridia bacterium]